MKSIRPASAAFVLENHLVRLSVDRMGRVESLYNKAARHELVAHPENSTIWRIVRPTGPYTLDFVLADSQRPPKIRLTRQAGEQMLSIAYDRLLCCDGPQKIALTLRWRLADDSPVLSADCSLDNRSSRPVDEVEFPVLGGVGGFGPRGHKVAHLATTYFSDKVAGLDRGLIFPDVLNNGLPETGDESNHYARREETSFLPGWLDLYDEKQGLYFCSGDPVTTRIKLEKFPKESPPPRSSHLYPPGTPRCLRLTAIHMPQVAPGKSWQSQKVYVMAHAGAWQAGADHYATLRRADVANLRRPPAWLVEAGGWSAIVGNLYTGEVFHNFARCAKETLRDAKVTGAKLVFYYGHTNLGAEGGDFDQHVPSEAMGGAAGFRAMVDQLHAAGIRIMLLNHLHGFVNRDVPQYRQMGLEKYAVLDAAGGPRLSRWTKETGLSLIRQQGPTPTWVEMCPHCRPWREVYFDHLRKMMALGIDALELDLFDPRNPCFSDRHGHAPGDNLLDAKLEFIRQARQIADSINPEFAFIGESLLVRNLSVLDGFYARHMDEFSPIPRLIFPQVLFQPALVGSYSYDNVNKSLQLGVGMDTEVDGARSTTLTACPELARYVGQANRFRLAHRDLFVEGTFRDHLGAVVKGDIIYSVLLGQSGRRALVLRNPHQRKVTVQARLTDVPAGSRLRLWQPFRKEKNVTRASVSVTLPPQHVAVLLAGPAE